MNPALAVMILANPFAVVELDFADEGDFEEAVGGVAFKSAAEGDVFAFEHACLNVAGDGVAFVFHVADREIGHLLPGEVEFDVRLSVFLADGEVSFAAVEHGVNVEFPFADADHMFLPFVVKFGSCIVCTKTGEMSSVFFVFFQQQAVGLNANA